MYGTAGRTSEPDAPGETPERQSQTCGEAVLRRAGWTLQTDDRDRQHWEPRVPDHRDYVRLGWWVLDDTLDHVAGHRYEQAGVGADDIDVCELHDCFTPTELVLMEDLGFSERGQG